MIIRLRNVKKEYSGRQVLNIDCLDFEEGKIYAVLGPNGSGKTTMLRIIAGIEKTDTGEIIVDNPGGICNRNLAYMPQVPYIFDIKVIDNVELGIKEMKNHRKIAVEALTQLGMEDFLYSPARSLSGGEQQRVALARTIVLNRSLYLLDEPASAADISAVRQIEEYIKSAKEKLGATIVFTTHSPSQALRVADEVLFLQEGLLIEKGSPQEVLHRPEKELTREFLSNWRI